MQPLLSLFAILNQALPISRLWQVGTLPLSSIVLSNAIGDTELNAEFTLSPSLMPIYLALKASEKVDIWSQDAILSEVSKTVEKAYEDERILQVVQEVARAKGSELHNISAFTGGMVAQEIIKVITKQYIPINNTCVFDGISSTTQVFKI